MDVRVIFTPVTSFDSRGLMLWFDWTLSVSSTLTCIIRHKKQQTKRKKDHNMPTMILTHLVLSESAARKYSWQEWLGWFLHVVNETNKISTTGDKMMNPAGGRATRSRPHGMIHKCNERKQNFGFVTIIFEFVIPWLHDIVSLSVIHRTSGETAEWPHNESVGYFYKVYWHAIHISSVPRCFTL